MEQDFISLKLQKTF